MLVLNRKLNAYIRSSQDGDPEYRFCTINPQKFRPTTDTSSGDPRLMHELTHPLIIRRLASRVLEAELSQVAAV
jgi:hypothetical protein